MVRYDADMIDGAVDFKTPHKSQVVTCNAYLNFEQFGLGIPLNEIKRMSNDLALILRQFSAE